MNQKVGRNDPCPCGSGKKFKQCCQKSQTAKKSFTAKKLTGQSSVISKLFQAPKKENENS